MVRPSANPRNNLRLPGSVQPQESPDKEKLLYELIKSKGNMGIWRADMRMQTHLGDNVLRKVLKDLEKKKLIKVVDNVSNPQKKVYMLSELEPAKEISGGTWYSGKNLDAQLIEVLKMLLLKFIYSKKVATPDLMLDHVRKTQILNMEIQIQEIEQILDAMVLDKEIEKVVSNMSGEFSSIHLGKICYRCADNGASKMVPLSSVPCGVCPKIGECTPDGIISPNTCVYFKEWLNF